jgi:hypothetical protein
MYSHHLVSYCHPNELDATVWGGGYRNPRGTVPGTNLPYSLTRAPSFRCSTCSRYMAGFTKRIREVELYELVPLFF